MGLQLLVVQLYQILHVVITRLKSLGLVVAPDLGQRGACEVFVPAILNLLFELLVGVADFNSRALFFLTCKVLASLEMWLTLLENQTILLKRRLC